MVHNACEVPLGKQLPDEGIPNSTSLRYTSEDNIYSAKTYGADGNTVAEINFLGKPHNINGIPVLKHVHQIEWYNGYPTKLPAITLDQYIGVLK